MTTREKLAEQMRQDWDRRVSHDYRFWMSDGHRDDAHMWETGARDFDILTAGLSFPENATALELGCGVGRMLKSASAKFSKVVGLDVSAEAIKKATELLGASPNVQLLCGSGIDLRPVEDASLDFVWSFAAITSMPTEVIAAYLRDIRRVIKPTGCVRLQVYLGKETAVNRGDTLHLRCFARENFERAVLSSGMIVKEIKELELPIQVSFKELGIEAFIATIEPTDAAAQEVEVIASALLPSGESETTGEFTPTELEAWMTVNYAEQLASDGDVEKARQALEYVDTHLRTSLIDTRDVLERIISVETKTRSTTKDITPGSGIPVRSEQVVEANNLVFEGNISIIKERFPEVYAVVLEAQSVKAPSGGVEVRSTQQGPVIWKGSNCLDHGDKPVSAADNWVSRTLQDKRNQTADHLVVVGFGAGYHLEALLTRQEKPVSCIEPDVQVFLAALSSRDVRKVLTGLRAISVGKNERPDCITPTSELLVRPQTLASDAGYVQKLKGVFFGKRGLAALRPRMAVLGPIEGGTIPIGQYTYTSLMRMGQRSRGIDMSGFGKGFDLLNGFATEPHRRNFIQATYLDMLSTTILEALTEKPVDILICMAQAPMTPRVLTELRKRGVITVLWFVEDYLRFTYWQQMAQYYDFIFTIQKDECIEKIKSAGAGEVHYLPTACDPYFHIPMNLSPEDKQKWGSPISFVGAGYHNRQQMFAALAYEPFKIWGSEWPGCKPFDRMVQEQSRRIAPEEYIKIFNATDVNLNLHSSTERDGVDPFGDFLNPRTFELASCGAFQLVDERALLGECFDIGKEMITFRNGADLKEKIHYYLERPEERAEIAQRSRARVLRDHTYDQRIEEMLSVIYASKYEQLRAKEDNGPWANMLHRSKSFPELHERCQKAYDRGEEANLDALISDIVTGNGKLSETEQKLLFMFHIRKQIIRMTREEAGEKS